MVPLNLKAKFLERKNLMRKRRHINLQLRKTASEARRKKLKMEATEVERQLLNLTRNPKWSVRPKQ